MKKPQEFIPCTPVLLPTPAGVDRIGVLAQNYWGDRATEVTFTFMERVGQDMIDKMTAFANSWGQFSKVRSRYTSSLGDAMVRIAFGNSGYWSYLGPDCLSIPRNQPTMNLQGFTVNTRESEWHRVVKHEWGHAWGCPHEQQRRAVLDLLDAQKTIAYFRQTQGWNEAEVRAQILTPLEEFSLMNPSPADVTSIMCYQFPGGITKDGQPIPGGLDFSAADRAYFARTYPLDSPPPPPPAGGTVLLVGYDKDNKETSRFRAQ